MRRFFVILLLVLLLLTLLVVAFGAWALHNEDFLKGQVSRIVHRACGMPDLEYLYLKLRQESLDFVPQK